jgi:hypothetical protein
MEAEEHALTGDAVSFDARQVIPTPGLLYFVDQRRVGCQGLLLRGLEKLFPNVHEECKRSMLR